MIDDEFIATEELRYLEMEHEMDMNFLTKSTHPDHCGISGIRRLPEMVLEPHRWKSTTLQQKWISVLDTKKVEWRDIPTVSENE